MLTVKLVKGENMKIVQAETVDISAAGKSVSFPEGDPAPLTNRVRSISCELYGRISVFHVGPKEDGEDLYDCAFIENAHGATTERVQAYIERT